EEGTLTACVPETLAAWAYTKVVSVVPGKHYAVRAEMRRDADASGFLLGTLTTSGEEGQSDPPAGDDWEVVAFEVGPGSDTELSVALYAVHAGASEDGGAVQIRDVALLELVEGYGQYWRVTLVDPSIEAAFSSTSVVLQGATAFYGNIPATPLEPGLASE